MIVSGNRITEGTQIVKREFLVSLGLPFIPEKINKAATIFNPAKSSIPDRVDAKNGDSVSRIRLMRCS